jgi:hypothetical protein
MTTVTGPVDGGRGSPFAAPLGDAGEYGYVVEEFFLHGEATAYEVEPGTELSPDGRWAVCPRASAPYRIRLLVVRPQDPARFNGVVTVNWQNVTLGFEAGTPQAHNLATGRAWVGVGAQASDIDGLVALGNATADRLITW